MADNDSTSVTKDLGIVSAYGYAKAAGYTGTEEEFEQIFLEFTENAPGLLDRLDDAVDAAEDAESTAVSAKNAAVDAKDAAVAAAATFTTDTTLAVSGKAADAKVTGDEITGLKTALDGYCKLDFSNTINGTITSKTIGNTINTTASTVTKTAKRICPVKQGYIYKVTVVEGTTLAQASNRDLVLADNNDVIFQAAMYLTTAGETNTIEFTSFGDGFLTICLDNNYSSITIEGSPVYQAQKVAQETKHDVTYLGETGRLTVIRENISGSYYVTQHYNLPAGNYHFHCDSVNTTDTDSSVCLINLGGGSQTFQIARNEPTDIDVTLISDSTKQYFYASDNASHSSGDDVVFNNVIISKNAITPVTTDGSIMSLANAAACGFSSTTGANNTSATDYWNTGLIWIGENKSILTANYTIYKVGFFDKHANFLNSYNTTHNNIPIASNACFIKVQFENSVIAFANASSVKLYVTNDVVVDPQKILLRGITIDNLSQDLAENIGGIGELTYSGEKIKINNRFDYEYVWYKNDSDIQSGAIYNNNLFMFTSVGTFYVFDLKTRTSVGNGSFPANLIPHCNVAFFGKAFYAEGDNYPILYVNAYNNEGLPKGTLYAFRIANDFTMTLIQTITIGFTTESIWTDGDSDTRPYGNFAVDFDTGFLYAYTLKDTSNVTRFFKFNMPSHTDGDVTFAETDIIEYWDCDYFPYIQDNFCLSGNIYILSGLGTDASNGYLRVINTVSKKEVSIINLNKTLYADLSTTFEPELIDAYNNCIICGNKNVYKLIV